MAKDGLRRRFWIELGLAATSLFLTVLTFISRVWIEAIFGVDPDHGDGSLEWLIVGVLAVTAGVLSLAARLEWRRATAATT